MFLAINSLFAQNRLYIHLVSHNEPTDTLENPIKYAKAKTNALQMAQIVQNKQVKWNLQTSDGFVMGALQDQSSSGNNIFRQLETAPYTTYIEIDPRSKNKNGRNVADQYYLLDSLGAHPTHTLGGFIWAVCPPAQSSSIDWLQYRDTIVGNIYHNKWQCELLSGAGSLTPHCNDLNDFGVFKPDTTTNFYSHNANKNLWCMGVGCAPVLDSLSDENAIIQVIKSQADSINSGLWPQNKFYVSRIMTNQREYGPLFFSKLNKVLDSLNTYAGTKIQWASITETMTAFHQWRNSTGLDYSMWNCDHVISATDKMDETNFYIAPNPSQGNCHVFFKDTQKHSILVTDVLGNKVWSCEKSQEVDFVIDKPGVYFVTVDQEYSQKLIIQ